MRQSLCGGLVTLRSAPDLSFVQLPLQRCALNERGDASHLCKYKVMLPNSLLWIRQIPFEFGNATASLLRPCRGSISLFADVTLAVIKKILSCTSKKLNEQPADFLWLLLFNPVSGSVNKMDAAHLRTGGALHPLKRTGHLENAPVALAGNEE